MKRSQRPSRSAKPGTAAGRRAAERMLGPISSWSAEAVHLKNLARADALGRRDAAGGRDLWHEYLDELYAPAYRAAVKEKSARTRASKKAEPARRSSWVRVKAHRRRRPGRKS